MVAGEKHFRHLHSAELRRLGVLRRLEKPVAAKALRGGRGRSAAKNAGKEPHRRIDHRGRGEFAARHHEVADGEEIGRERLDARVETLVVPAHEYNVLRLGKRLGVALGELAAGGGRHDDARSAFISPRAGASEMRPCRFADARLHRREPRAALHQHPGAATVRAVVDFAPAPLAEFAQVDDVHFARALLDGARNDGFREEPLEHLRLHAYDVYLQHRPYYTKKEGRPERGGLAFHPSTVGFKPRNLTS